MWRILFVAGLLLAAVESRADTGAAQLRLADVLAEAREHNPKIQAARSSWDMERSKIVSARTWADPKVGLNVEQIPRNKRPTTQNAGTDMYMIEQDIPFPGKLSARALAQHHAAKIAEYGYQRTVLDVQADVTGAYYGLWELLENIRITQAHVRIWDRLANVSERQYAAGRVLQRDVLRAQMEADKIATDLANFESLLPAAQARLNALLNRPVTTPLGDPAAPEVDFRADSLPELETAAASGNVDLKSASHHIEHTRAMLKAARYDLFPDFTAGWSRMSEIGMPKVYNASLFLNIPFYFWKQRAEIAAAGAEVQHAEAVSEQLRNEVAVDLREAAAEVQNAARTADIYRISVLPRSRKALDVVESAYLAGRANFLDLHDAQGQLLTEERTYASTLAMYGKSRASLERIVGMPAVNPQPPHGGGHHHE